jgi:predicted esterase
MRTVRWFVGGTMLMLAGCSAQAAQPGTTCQTASAAACMCSTGQSSTMTCGADGHYGACACGLTASAGSTATAGSTSTPAVAAGTSGTPSLNTGTAGMGASVTQGSVAGMVASVAGAAGTVVGPSAGSSGSSAGTGAIGGASGASGMSAAGAAAMAGPGMPVLPAKMGDCPKLINGATVKIGRMSVIVYIDPDAKNKPGPGGPIINYYHATGGQPSEVMSGFGMANIKKVTDMGGVVATYTTTACPNCSTTDDLVWYVEDGPIQDQLVACAIEQAKIDVTHIHALGWSAGALHSTWVGINRSNYMASFISYSGGMPPWPGQNMPQNANTHVSSILTYGVTGVDNVIVDFPTQSKDYFSTFSAKGWYTMMCATGGGHMIDRNVAPVSLQFFMDHPFDTTNSPYKAMIPSAFPKYCSNTAM